MRILLVKCFAFLSALLTFVLVIGRFDNLDMKVSKNENILKLHCKYFYDSLDILFVGNSYTYSGVDMNAFDSTSLRAFNLGIATAGPYFYELIISEYLREIRKKPKAILLLVSPTSFSSKSDNFVAYPIHRYLNNPYSNEQIIFRYKLYKSYKDLLGKSFNKGLKNLAYRLARGYTDDENCAAMDVNKGYIPSDSVNNLRTIKQTETLYMSFKNDIFDKNKGKYLLSLARSLTDKGIQVVFYNLPTNSLINYFDAKFLREYTDYLTYLSRNYTYIPTRLPSDDKYFRNIDHLNSTGAKRVTRELLMKFCKNFSTSNTCYPLECRASELSE